VGGALWLAMVGFVVLRLGITRLYLTALNSEVYILCHRVQSAKGAR